MKESDELRNVRKRYSDLADFHARLNKKHPKVLAVKFPPKRLFKKDLEVALERQAKLNDVMQEIVRDC